MREGAQELAPVLGVKAACEAVGLPRASFYHLQKPPRPPSPARPHLRSHRALSPEEEQTIRELLNSERFVDQAPRTIYATLLDEGYHYCSLTLHADRGAAMTSKTLAELLIDLGVAQSHSRPTISDDNPYSESQFKTMKYRPSYPERFASVQAARAWMRWFAAWYNHEHKHSGIALLPPAVVHSGQATDVLAKCQETLCERRHPIPAGAPTNVPSGLQRYVRLI